MVRVSVIVAAYQAARTIEQTLQSVFEQTYAGWEIIVGDDCSADATPQLAAAFGDRVRVVRSSANVGTPAATRMMAITHSEAELIAFLDGDDLWGPDYLAAMVAAYDRERRHGAAVGAVCCDAELLLADGSVAARTYMDVIGRPSADIDVDVLLRRNAVYTSVLLPRAVFDDVGGLSSELRGTDDYDLWIRICESGRRIVYVDRPLARYRVRHGSISTDTRAMAGASAEVYRRALARGQLTRGQRRLARRALHLQDAAARLAELMSSRRRTGRLPAGTTLRALPLFALAAIENLARAGSALRWFRAGLPSLDVAASSDTEPNGSY